MSEAVPEPDRPKPEPTFIDYRDFGRTFFITAVTEQRVADGAANLAGRPIEVGPLSFGPMGLVKVRARGEIGTPTVAPRKAGEHVGYTLTVPLTLELRIDIGPDRHKFAGDVQVQLAVTARPAAPLLIVVDIAAPSAESVRVDLRAEGLRGSVLQQLAGLENEVRKAVIKFVTKELDKPELRKARTIDVAKAVAANRR